MRRTIREQQRLVPIAIVDEHAAELRQMCSRGGARSARDSCRS